MALLKTAKEVTGAANKAKMDIALKGTNGDEEALHKAVFLVVCAHVAVAKMEHLITVEMRKALKDAVNLNCLVWDMWERKCKTHYRKNHTKANACVGARTRVTVDGVVDCG